MIKVNLTVPPSAANDQRRDQQQQSRLRLMTPFLPTPQVEVLAALGGFQQHPHCHHQPGGCLGEAGPAPHRSLLGLTAQCSRTCPQPQGRASPQVRTLGLSAGPRYDQSLELSLAHR
jgi:hypothetical protein